MQKLDQSIETGLPPTAMALMQGVFERTPWLDEAILFGSRAKGCAAPGSDIDLACRGTQDRLAIARLADALDELPLPYVFDLVGLETLRHRPLLDHIERVGIRIYTRQRGAEIAEHR